MHFKSAFGNPNRAEAHDVIAPPAQEVTHLEQLTDLTESVTSDQSTAGLAATRYDILPTPSNNGANQDSNITRTRPEATLDKIDIPPHILEAAGKAVDSALAISSGRMISFGKILHLGFGDEILTPREIALYKRAVKQDPRARYKSKGWYLI